jgi:beta-lactamase regulating signal transducer with metallopeptidase domain
MSRFFIAYMGSLMLRSIGIAVIAGICSWRIRNVAIRHAVWVMVLAAMVLMPAIDYMLPPSWVPDRVQEIFSEYSQPRPALALKAAILSESSVSIVESQPALQTSPIDPRPADWWRVAVVLYLLVAFVMVARLAMGYRKIWRLRRAAKPIPDAVWRQTVAPVHPRWRVPVVLESDAVQVPMTVGLFGRQSSCQNPGNGGMTGNCERCCFTRWRTSVVAIGVSPSVAALARCAYWLNPLPWFLERRLSELAEQASDDASITCTGNTTRYAEILLEFASTAQNGGRIMKGSVAMASYKIQSRIERVLGDPKAGNGIVKAAGWILVLIISAPVIYSAAAVQVASGSPLQRLQPQL